MSEGGEKKNNRSQWKIFSRQRIADLQRGDQLFLVLALVIGASTGLAVVAFILLTERLGMRLYPVGSSASRRMLLPVWGSLGWAICCFAIFPTRGEAACRRRKLRFSPAKA